MTKTRKCYTDVSESLGFGMSTLQRWVAQYKQEQQGIKPKTGNALTKEQREIQRLRKQVQQLTLERDILITDVTHPTTIAAADRSLISIYQ